MKKQFLFTAIAIAALTLISCAGKSKKSPEQQNETPNMAEKFMKSTEKTETILKPADSVQPEVTAPLYELAAKHGFKMGTVINPQQLNKASYTDMIKADFNSITAGNEFKAYSLLS